MLQRRLCWPAAACVGQLLDQAHGQQFRQALQAAQVRHHADIDFLHTKEGILRGIADPGAADHVQRTADTAALNRHDHWNAQLLDARENLLHVPQKLRQGRSTFR